MRAVIQRVNRASVHVDDEVVGQIASGVLVLLGVFDGDSSGHVRKLARKCALFRIFEDERGRMGRSLVDLAEAGAPVGALVVSQFTLAADGRKGRRPSFDAAAPPEVAEPLYELFCDELRGHGVRVETGTFRKHMCVELVNDGPVTFVLDESARTP